MGLLPEGYKRLLYIESTGTQYIDAGFKPNQNTKIVVDFQHTGTLTSLGAVFGARNSATSATFLFAMTPSANTYRVDYATTQYQNIALSSDPYERRIISLDKGLLTLSTGEMKECTQKAFQCSYNLYLFRFNNAGSSATPATGKLYSCQIYDNSTLVRDYVPAKLIDGSVGLLDKVSGVFYGNAGTGSFIAGPERPSIEPPQAPEGFQIPYTDFANILLMWPIVPGADGYNIARDGELVVSTPQPYLHDTGLNMNTEYTYSITAYNVGGESEPVEVTASTTDFKLITDRTAADVESVIAAINSGVLPSNWFAGMKGAYNATDLNRVESAVLFVIERLRVAGWYLQVQSKHWTFTDFPSASEMQRYLDNVRLLRSALPVGMPAVPADMNLFRYEEANTIETILERLDATVANIMKNIYYSIEIYSGEVR